MVAPCGIELPPTSLATGPDGLGDQLPAGFTLHQLRHSCASYLINQGASVKAVQEQLGHSSPMVTLNTYTHLYDDDLDHLFAGLDRAHRVGKLNRDGDQMGTKGGSGLCNCTPNGMKTPSDLDFCTARPEGFEPPT